MALLTRRRGRRSGGGLVVAEAGEALVVHGPGGMSDEQRLLSATAADPVLRLVLAELPARAGEDLWKRFAAAIPREDRGVRLVLTGPLRGAGAAVGQWLANRIRRPVVAADGLVQPTADGALFVRGGASAAWVRFSPGGVPLREGVRFPSPDWETFVTAQPCPLGVAASAEPLPCGMWLRADGDERWLAVSRARLVRSVVRDSSSLTVVLSGQEIPPLPLEAVRLFWALLPDGVRARVRFVQYGPVAGASPPAGPALTKLLGTDVTCYTGIPVGSGVFSVRADGSHGWRVFARSLTFQGDAAVPRVTEHREPVAGLTELEPGVYRYGPDSAVEVVPAGVWVRPLQTPSYADIVRGLPLDPLAPQVFHEEDPAWRIVASGVAARLEGVPRETARLVAISVDGTPVDRTRASRVSADGVPRDGGGADSGAADGDVPMPRNADETDLPLLSSLVDTGFFPPLLFTDETDRETEVSETDTETDTETVAGILARHPEFTGHQPDDALAEAVAVRTYLRGQEPHGREQVAAGLARLPIHRGAAITHLCPEPAWWEHDAIDELRTEHDFLHLLTVPAQRRSGDTDLLVWSMTGRRTTMLEPEPAPGRVVFLPGTKFKVLAWTAPADGKRGRILLRELSATEIGADGSPAANRSSLDEFARVSLRRAAQKWELTKATQVLPEHVAAAVERLPGQRQER